MEGSGACIPCENFCYRLPFRKHVQHSVQPCGSLLSLAVMTFMKKVRLFHTGDQRCRRSLPQYRAADYSRFDCGKRQFSLLCPGAACIRRSYRSPDRSTDQRSIKKNPVLEQSDKIFTHLLLFHSPVESFSKKISRSYESSSSI